MPDINKEVFFNQVWGGIANILKIGYISSYLSLQAENPSNDALVRHDGDGAPKNSGGEIVSVFVITSILGIAPSIISSLSEAFTNLKDLLGASKQLKIAEDARSIAEEQYNNVLIIKEAYEQKWWQKAMIIFGCTEGTWKWKWLMSDLQGKSRLPPPPPPPLYHNNMLPMGMPMMTAPMGFVTGVPRVAKTKAASSGRFELDPSSSIPTFLCCLFLCFCRFTYPAPIFPPFWLDLSPAVTVPWKP